MAGPGHPGRFSEGFRRQIVRLYDNGKPAAGILRECDTCGSARPRWVKGTHESGSAKARDDGTLEQGRILELERENRRLRMEAGV